MSPLSVRRRWSLLALMVGGVGCASSKPEPMTDPEVSLDLPLDGALLAGDVALAASARDDVAVERVEFYLGSERVGVDSAEPYEAILSSTALLDGGYTLRAVAINTAGLSSADEISITIDNTAPALEITSPAEGDTVQGALTASATASDAEGIGEVRFTLDGAEIAAISAEPYAVDVDSAALAFGPHRLEATATDLAGNEGTASVSFNVDNPPVVSWRSPDDTTVSGSVEIAASATDDDQVVALSLVVDGEEVDSATDGGPVSTILDTCGFASGELIEIEAIAVDSGGNVSDEPRELSVNQPLSVEIDEIPGVAEPSQAVGAQVGDDQRVVTVLWDVDGAGVATATSASDTSADCFDCGCSLYSSTFSTADLSEGVHTLTATATNEAGETASASTTFIVGYDHDGDGYDSEWYGGDDCDDADSGYRPDASETCDGLDNDCDGSVDEDFDLDGDGFLDASLCAGLHGATDCDDLDPDVSPDGIEDCDGVDDDCDGRIDNALPWSSETTTFGASSTTLAASALWGDVYEAIGRGELTSFQVWLNPGSTALSLTWAVYEADPSTGDYVLLDSNTSSASGSTGWYSSGAFSVELTVGRSYLLAVSATTSLARYGTTTPTPTSGSGLRLTGYLTDDASLPSTISSDPVVSQVTYQRVSVELPDSEDDDADADGTSPTCGDCDDGDTTVGPDAVEVCDDQDNDCDGTIDEASDGDGDGEGGCTDCDDGDPAVYTGAPERCDGIDGDCDGTVDEDPVDGGVYYTDGDGDGYGTTASGTARCEVIAGESSLDGDCDDGLASIHPGASETCDEVDEDCDGLIDEDFDVDGDGYGSCLDCNDSDADINPGAIDLCEDTVDSDCDGVDASCRVSGTTDAGSAGIRLMGEDEFDRAGLSVDARGD